MTQETKSLTNLSLYKTDVEIQKILYHDMQEDGQITEEAAEKLNALMSHKRDKAIACGYYIRHINDEVKKAEEQLKRFSDRIKVFKNQTTQLKKLLTYVLDKDYGGKLDDGPFKIFTAKGVESVKIKDPDSIPEDFQKVVTAPDKSKIKEALKKGEEISGAELVVGDRSLRIRG